MVADNTWPSTKGVVPSGDKALHLITSLFFMAVAITTESYGVWFAAFIIIAIGILSLISIASISAYNSLGLL